jgi:arylsulfatase A-like enzyme
MSITAQTQLEKVNMFNRPASVCADDRTSGTRHLRYELMILSGVVAFVLRAQPMANVCLAAGPASRPNIVILLADDMGYSDLGCYGGEIETPTLDALAKNGLRFLQFYNTTRCWPTRAALLTGYYAQQVRRDTIPDVPKTGGGGTRPAWAPLLPEMLKPYGYRTYHSGKWHVDGEPINNGFDHSYCLQDSDRFFSPTSHFEDGVQLAPVARDSGYYATTAIADHAVKCLREHAAKYADQPFFQYVAFIAPHFPLHALQEDVARYRGKYLAGWDQVREQRWRRLRDMGMIQCEPSAVEREVGPPYDFPAALKKLGAGEVNRPLPWSELTDQQRAFQSAKMAVHAAMVDRMDREIGKIVEQLRDMGAIENTLIFFLSDNGASAEIMVRGDDHDPSAPPGSAASYLCLGPGWSTCANTPFRRHKTWVHEGGISTPLIVHWPRGITAPGSLRHNPGHVIDMVPTILEAAGIEPITSWKGASVPDPPGKSLLPVFSADNRVAREYLWWLHEDNRAIRVGNWKLVADNRRKQWELYDLDKDRAESVNLASEYPDKVQELQQIWESKWREFRALATRDLSP